MFILYYHLSHYRLDNLYNQAGVFVNVVYYFLKGFLTDVGSLNVSTQAEASLRLAFHLHP